MRELSGIQSRNIVQENGRTVLVTGAAGFIGRALCPVLERRGWRVRKSSTSQMGPDWLRLDSRGGDTDWSGHVTGCRAVVHLAARVHLPRAEGSDSERVFQEVNAEATLQLGRAAVAAGVSRFAFISSVKVNGEGREAPYREDDAPAPEDAYGRSKWAAEKGLMEIARGSGMELVILRLPLVYGPQVRANFLRMMQWVDREIPLPLAAIENRRSLLGIENLTDAVAACLENPRAAGHTFFISDQQDVSTPDLLRRLAGAMGRRSRLWWMPEAALRFAASASIGSHAFQRLTGSLTVDSNLISRELGWIPPHSLDEGLKITARWFNDRSSARHPAQTSSRLEDPT